MKADCYRIGGESVAQDKDRRGKKGACDGDVHAAGRDHDAVRLGSGLGRDDEICLIGIVGSEADEDKCSIGIVGSAADEDRCD